MKAGGAIAGTHCGSDTLYPAKDRPWNEAYGELIGAYFDGHPPGFQKIKIKVEDPKHPAGQGIQGRRAVRGRDVHLPRRPVQPQQAAHHPERTRTRSAAFWKRAKSWPATDNDYAISWCQEVGKGRSFYTSLGHRKEVWKDPRFQEHLLGGLRWAIKLEEGDATPSAKLKKE